MIAGDIVATDSSVGTQGIPSVGVVRPLLNARWRSAGATKPLDTTCRPAGGLVTERPWFPTIIQWDSWPSTEQIWRRLGLAMSSAVRKPWS